MGGLPGWLYHKRTQTHDDRITVEFGIRYWHPGAWIALLRVIVQLLTAGVARRWAGRRPEPDRRVAIPVGEESTPSEGEASSHRSTAA
ncbi:MAG: hypothetical protein LC808_29170 [Actinobacteria bacterium]|nr:hypothetical protein [Actinomycetota bacterium]